MPRSHGRVASAIWQDADFMALPVTPQRMYLFLLSQPNLSHLGVLPLTTRRWARSAAGYNSEHLLHDLDSLTAATFVLIDEETEELLIRSLFRNDGVYRQPNLLLSAIATVPSVSSPELKQALLSEVDRITLDDVKEDKRNEIGTHLGTLREALARGSGNPSPGPTEGMPKPPTRAQAQPLPLAPSPSPLSPSDSGRRKRLTPPPDIFAITPELMTWGRQNAPLVADPKGETARFLDYHRAKGSVFKDWNAAWRNWMGRAQKYAAEQKPAASATGNPATAWAREQG